jgi:outer membrane protein OmpA-like peptidoglycan-associated protein
MAKMMTTFLPRFSLCMLLGLTACSPSSTLRPDGDREPAGAVQGALTGAGAGAVTAFQVSSPTGPGAFVGAGIGAVAGAIQGAQSDEEERALIQMQKETVRLQYRAEVQAILERYLARRIELHPSRDIFPADLFFSADGVKLTKQGDELVHELARLNKDRLPWSRLVIGSYAKANDDSSIYASYLTKRRAIALGDAFVKYGIEPRRIETRPVVINGPLVVAAGEPPLRYAQVIELIAVDR